MLRYVFRIHRKPTETWVDYMKRSAKAVGDISDTYFMRDWVVEYRRRKWRTAGALARKTYGRWSSNLITWTPVCGVGRARGRPKTRWSDDLERFAGGHWHMLASDEELWHILEEGFVTKTTIS